MISSTLTFTKNDNFAQHQSFVLSATLDEQVLPPDGGGSAVNAHRLVTGNVARMKGTYVEVGRRVVNGRCGVSDANDEIT